MGNLIWHDLARLTSITASVYAVWASFFGLLYRKFFWDFVGGTLRDPGGLQPSPGAAPFVTLIVKAPVIQASALILGMFIIALELPLPKLKQFSWYRNFVVRIILLVFQAFLTILFYQGTNAALYSLIAAMCYYRAVALGEIMKEAAGNRGKESAA